MPRSAPDGAVAEPVIADLSDREQAAGLVERAEAIVGPLDLLISNAGLEPPGAYTAFTDAELLEVAEVNLLAPMLLARHALPGMLARGRGHVVMISSLAGRGGNAFNVPYATTKAGLLGCARSLRAELEGTPVSASVICPGFIANDGMYADIQREFGVNAPVALRAVDPDRVANAVVQAISRRPAGHAHNRLADAAAARDPGARPAARRASDRRHRRTEVLPNRRRARRSRARGWTSRECRPDPRRPPATGRPRRVANHSLMVGAWRRRPALMNVAVLSRQRQNSCGPAADRVVSKAIARSTHAERGSSRP